MRARKQAYRIKEGSLQDRFMRSRAKVQVYGGAYANGKTSGVCVKTLQIVRDYPGANILMARSTYPKLNDTLRKEFLKWCPKKWIKSFPLSKNADNTCKIDNETHLNFRYIDQTSRGTEETTSNLLSATYDLIVVDQIEDPEITEKDFDDLLGRLRGQAPYVGDDPTMPRSGPRWMLITLNPTSNWSYRRLIKPLHVYQKTGIILDNLLCVRDPESGKPVLDDNGKPELLIELVEGSTYDNRDNLPDDFIQTLEAAYQGQMRKRFLGGEWGVFEGLVYPSFDMRLHGVDREEVMAYFDEQRAAGYPPQCFEGYDYGLARPACYGLWYSDRFGNTFLMDGFYEREYHVTRKQAPHIKRLRSRYGVPKSNEVLADPSIFKRHAGRKLVGESIANMFAEEGVPMIPGNNDIMNGIVKVSTYMEPQEYHVHPLTGEYNAPRLYYCRDLTWYEEEVSNYRWRKDTSDETEDRPIDRNDHAMDMKKYAFSRRPNVAVLRIPPPPRMQSSGWREVAEPRQGRRGSPSWRHK